MQTRPLVLLGGLLLALPAAFAHSSSPGLPKTYCEDSSEWNVHDYGVPAEGVLISNLRDGNTVGDCNADTVFPDYDGHLEWAVGGAWLLVQGGDGVSSGTIACYGGEGHHPEFGPITVTDNAFASTIPFTVAADTVSFVPPVGPDCGDFENDVAATCISTCFVTFAPGPDGAYQVFVGDVSSPSVSGGHVETPGASGGTIPVLAHPGFIGIQRSTGGSYFFSGSPDLACMDMVASIPVSPGMSIWGPNPEVRCVISTPGVSVCNSVTAGAGGPSSGTGVVLVTSSCLGGLSVTASYSLSGVAVGATSTLPHGYVPWTCAVDDAAATGLVGYSVFCQVNA